MNVREAIKSAAKQLQPARITCAEDKHLGELEAEILLAHVLKRDRAFVFAHPDYPLPPTIARAFDKLVARRKKHEPIAYILGEKEFYGLPFKVNRATLIPRPETELMVDLAMQTKADIFWDVGTGSGAVAITLAKKFPRSTVIATDISTKALATAKQNAKQLSARNVSFFKANLLDATAKKLFADMRGKLVIVANLPYLPTSDKKKLEPDVVDFEPSSALFVGKDGTELIEKFLEQLAKANLPFTSAFFEFDPPQATKLKRIATQLFKDADVTIHKDLAQRDRVLEITPSTPPS